MPAVLFVCTANICRSPMAMVLFEQRLKQAGVVEGWRVESAGTWARDGELAARGSQAVMQEHGLDLGRHRSRVVTEELLGQFDLILVMNKSHQEALRTEFPRVAARVHLLSSMAGYTYDVRDPIGGPLADYREAARNIDGLLAQGFDQIIRTARANAGERS